jgi:hypothetical protein
MLLDIITLIYCIVPVTGMTIGLVALVREERFSRVIVDTFPRRTVTR